MRYLFVGGPGRSGTSFVADRIGSHPEIGTFRDVELKLFFELDGLYDLERILTADFSPNRAMVSMMRFGRMRDALFHGQFGQDRLDSFPHARELDAAFSSFEKSLLRDGMPVPVSRHAFIERARILVAELARVACSDKGASMFLEKTPHNLLKPQFLNRLCPDALYVHVIRDPRGIAASLLSQSWGPNDLPGASAWVSAYFQAWASTNEFWGQVERPLLELRIEDLSSDTARFSEKVLSFLDVDASLDILEGADVDLLYRWLNRVSQEDLDFLNSRLGPLAQTLGYELEVLPHDKR